MAPTLSDILSQAEANPRTVAVKVLLRQDLATRHAELSAELDASLTREALSTSLGDGGSPRRLAEQISALEAEIEDAKVEFKFKAAGRRAWADLLAKHAPTKQQVAADKRVTFNPETFPIAAIATCCIVPEGIDEAAVHRLEDVLSDAQFSLLWNACVDANLGGGDSPKSLAAGRILQASSRSATTAASGESPEANS